MTAGSLERCARDLLLEVKRFGVFMDAVVESSIGASNVALKPCDDLEFESHEVAYLYYKEYAKSVGFGTAKLSSRRSRATKEFIDAKFSCIRYGSKQQSDDAINPRPSPKIGCKASMHVKRKQDGKWYIYSFVKEHNHELLPSQVHLFRSHRDADPLKNDAKLRRRKHQSSASKLFGAYQNVDPLDGYMRNQHDKGRQLVLEAGDAQLLLEFFMRMQEEDPKFFYAVDFNEEHRLRNLFWVDAKGVEDYNYFSDVVCFDTTYFSNKYKLPLVLFIGVNHHMKPSLLGCGLIADETAYTFVWLMQTWLLAMGERPPEVMLTDQKHDLKVSIEAVFPRTRHFFCLWYILEKIPHQLEYLSLWHENVMRKFSKCILKSSTEEQFEKRWWKLLERFHLREVEWIQSLYVDRRYWVPTFMRDVSFAFLSTMTRAESLTASFDKYVHKETSVREFIEKYRVILEDRYEEEAKADFDAWHETPELKSPSPFEKQVSLVYTHEIFKKFQVEVLGVAACHLRKEFEDHTVTKYSVKDFEDNQNYMVEWNASMSDIYCSCHSFDYKGYLCRHTIVVLQMSGVFSIPPKYVLKRWTNAARSRHPLGENMDEVQAKIRRFNDLCRRAIILGEEGSLSQESYNIATCAIKEALKQCSGVTGCVENGAGYDTIGSVQEANSHHCRTPESQVAIMTKTTRMIEVGKEKGNNRSNVTKKGKVPAAGDSSAEAQDSFHLVNIPNLGLAQSHAMLPVHLQNTVPQVFHDFTSAQFRNMTSSNLHETQLPP